MSRYRDSMATALIEGCSVCAEPRGFLTAVHHRERDRSDSRRSSLDNLCPRCHAIRHLRWTDKGWVLDNKSITPRLIVENFDMQTKTLHLPKTDRQKKIQRIRDYFLVHECEDQDKGTSWDLEFLAFLEQWEKQEESVTISIEEIWG